MNEIKKRRLGDKLRDAFNAFRGKPVRSIAFGVEVKRCDDCGYYQNSFIRDNLLVTVGARAAYMDGVRINLPSGVEGEAILAEFAVRIVDHYLNCNRENNFDEYIETWLEKEYGYEKGD